MFSKDICDRIIIHFKIDLYSLIVGGAWKITTETGGQKGGVPLDLVVTFIGSEGESELCPLRSNRDHPFQIGQTDVCEVWTCTVQRDLM